MSIANFFGFELFSNFVMVFFISFLYLITFRQNLRISGLETKIQRLTQEIALGRNGGKGKKR
jgi:hypothetical protein